VIFAKIEDVYSPLFEFPSSMQDMPRDLFTEAFYPRRSVLIANKKQEIDHTPSVSALLASLYHQHHRQPCRLIEDWNRYPLEALRRGVEVLSKEALLQILDRLLRDFNAYRSGLPDLFFYDPQPLFVEVKSEADSLKEHQIEWQQFLAESAGIPVEVLLINHSKRKVHSVIQQLSERDHKIITTPLSHDLREDNQNVKRQQPAKSGCLSRVMLLAGVIVFFIWIAT